ncbi:SRPBCC family protein [Nakamurella alba]|nr:SRPBCC family protein [Nakamurella alba]
MNSTPIHVSVSVESDIDPVTLYDLVSDITTVGDRSPETVSARWTGELREPVVGARFKGSNRLGMLRWSTRATVTAADRGSRFAFRVAGTGGPLWTYTFSPRPDGAHGCVVTESVEQFEPSPGIQQWLRRRAGVTDRAAHLAAGMRTTLDRLCAAASPVVSGKS